MPYFLLRYKGVREGTISENTSYYIFVQSPDGAFEAIPAQEWYNFAPVSRYKYLNADEAEEEFSRSAFCVMGLQALFFVFFFGLFFFVVVVVNSHIFVI